MVKIPRRGKPRYLKADDVEDGDLATIIEPPQIQDAEDSKFGKERTIITINLHRTKGIYRLGMNNTSNDRLVDAYSEDGETWIDKEVRFEKRLENIRGTDRYVLYASPSMPASIQQNLTQPEKPTVSATT
jgi:hypothetical protein